MSKSISELQSSPTFCFFDTYDNVHVSYVFLLLFIAELIGSEEKEEEDDVDAEEVDDKSLLLSLLADLRAVSKTTKLSSSYAVLLSSEEVAEHRNYFVFTFLLHLLSFSTFVSSTTIVTSPFATLLASMFFLL